jgi:hypothetical protein
VGRLLLLAVIVVVVGVVCGDFSYGKRRERIWMELQEFAKYAEGYFATLNVCAPRAYNGPSLSLLVSLARADLLV